MTCATSDHASSRSLPDGIGEREAELLLGALARVKARRFGRLVVTVSDARVVDVEVIEKIDRQSLIPLVNMRLVRPSLLVDINRIAELDYIRAEDGHLAIGAVARDRDVELTAVAVERALGTAADRSST